jgi:hypothetical protein
MGTSQELPTRSGVTVDVWQERDRLHISVNRAGSDKTVMEWWDEDAEQMFEDGFFRPWGPMKEKDPRFIDSVLTYCEDMGWLAKRRAPQVFKNPVGVAASDDRYYHTWCLAEVNRDAVRAGRDEIQVRQVYYGAESGTKCAKCGGDLDTFKDAPREQVKTHRASGGRQGRRVAPRLTR